MRSRHRNTTFRAAAARLYGSEKIQVSPHGLVERPATGGAFVEMTVWVSEEEVQKQADMDAPRPEGADAPLT